MSDLAPFVAATLRDKVVQELQEENQTLRSEIVENTQKNRVQNALNNVLNVAITGPSPPEEGEDPIVYAMECISRRRFEPSDDGFSSINQCTLGDLPTAQIYVNGICFSPVSRLRPQFHFFLHVNDGDQIKSLDNFLNEDGDDYADFILDRFSDSVGLLRFVLKDVPKKKWLEFVEVDCDEFLASPRTVDVWGRRYSWEELIAFFGGETIVDFDEADDIDF